MTELKDPKVATRSKPETVYMEQLGERLLMARLVRALETGVHLPQKAVAKAIGVAPSSIVRGESGKRRIAPYTIIQWSKFLFAPMEYIFFGEGEIRQGAAKTSISGLHLVGAARKEHLIREYEGRYSVKAKSRPRKRAVRR